MPSGQASRTRTGCYTCRIRKKKCDEEHPRCGNCQARSLQCFGYETPPPPWMQGKSSWKEVLLTKEAAELQTIAEAKYKASRRSGKAIFHAEAGTVLLCQPSGELSLACSESTRTTSSPDSIWWDAGLCASLPYCRSPHEDARLIKLYLDFVFPIQFTFYPMSTTIDHSWLIRGLCSNEARYHAALSISSCFDTSLREPARTDRIGLSVEVMNRQAIASSGLRTIIDSLHQHHHSPRKAALITLKILEVMHQLLSLEVFSMLEGAWELHHRATRILLNTLHAYKVPSPCDQNDADKQLSPVDMTLKGVWSPEIKRNFEFHVTCVVWVDVIANATFGLHRDISRYFDYIPYLRTDDLKTQDIMGCHSSVMAEIAEISLLDDWKTDLISNDGKPFEATELSFRALIIANRLEDLLRQMETHSEHTMTDVEEGSRLVTLQFGWAAQLYLYVTVNGGEADSPEIASLVSRILNMLETLPNWLMIRVNWPFTIAGCLASENIHERFRSLVGLMVAKKQPLGMTWKGLMVMEECWCLRQSTPKDTRGRNSEYVWRWAMKRLEKRILLV